MLLKKIKKWLDVLVRYTLALAAVVFLVFPAVLPFVVEFHPLLVVPYYGILWWTACLNIIMKRHMSLTLRFNQTCGRSK